MSRQYVWGGLLVSGLYLVCCLPLLFQGADDIAMVGVFSLDESVAAKHVKRILENGLLTKPPFTYGGLFYYLPVLILNVFGLFGSVSEQVIVIVLRATGLVAGGGCLWMVYRLGQQVFDEKAGLIAAALLLPLPVFLRWSVETHPDLLQVFWILCALFFCCRMVDTFRTSDAWMSAGFAGLAFGTKYGGIFLLPVIGLAVVLAARQEGEWRLFQKPFMVGLVGVPVVFGMVFGLTNPHAILDPVGLLAQVANEKAIMTFGHTVQTDRSGWTWFGMVPNVMGWVNTVVLLVAIGVMVRKGGHLSRGHLVLAAWCLVMMAYLAIQVRVFYLRHLLPVLPVFLLFAGFVYGKLGRWMVERFKVPQIVSLPLILLLAGFLQAQNAWAMFDEKWGRTQDNAEITAGRWMGEYYGKETSILFDTYAYVPSKFEDSFVIAPAHTFGVVNHFEPDVIVLRDARFRRFENLADAERSRVGKHSFYDIHYFYRFISAGALTDYKQVKKWGGVTIYERQTARNHDLSFAECKELFRTKRLINLGQAREVMGDVHFTRSQWTLAARDYTLGTQATPDYTSLHYKLGRTFIAGGELDHGKNAFAKAVALIDDISYGDWANVHLDIAQSYFASGFYADAHRETEKALEYNENLATGHFDLGASLIGLACGEEAEEVYAQAVKRFGADTTAVTKLQVLARQQKYRAQAQKILARYFQITGP